MKPIELYNIYVKAIELVTCIGGGYYARHNFQIMLLEFARQVITA